MKRTKLILRQIFFLVVGLIISNISRTQVTFHQKQNITIDDTGPILTLRNNDETGFSEFSIINDENRLFSIGISGSQNTFFSSASTPYIFNGSGRDFHFRSGTEEQFLFEIDTAPTMVINKYGTHIINKPLGLTQGFEANELVTNSDGSFHIISNRSAQFPDTTITITKLSNYVGLFTTEPKAQVHIQQNTLPITPSLGGGAQDFYGLRIHDWTIAENSNNRLAFINNGILVSYIEQNTGAYVNNSDIQLKDNIEAIGSILDSVRKLEPVRYNYKNSTRPSMGFIAQEVEEVFPELVVRNGDYKGLAYDDFAAIAIKAIQELTLKVEALEKQLKNQKN